jgi:hypothetical protein
VLFDESTTKKELYRIAFSEEPNKRLQMNQQDLKHLIVCPGHLAQQKVKKILNFTGLRI